MVEGWTSGKLSLLLAVQRSGGNTKRLVSPNPIECDRENLDQAWLI
jgi:hypothetical protein